MVIVDNGLLNKFNIALSKSKSQVFSEKYKFSSTIYVVQLN
jgi:hypothetical protein